MISQYWKISILVPFLIKMRSPVQNFGVPYDLGTLRREKFCVCVYGVPSLRTDFVTHIWSHPLLNYKVVDMVERRFSPLAGQTMATMQLRLSINPVKKQLSFRFGPDQRSSKVSFILQLLLNPNHRSISHHQRLDRCLEERNPTASSASFSPCGTSWQRHSG